MRPEILIIDNYDSFTYNLVQCLGALGADPVVFRNDEITAARALAREPAGIVLGPGPKSPDDAGICSEMIRLAAGRVPLLGVCLGHQCLGSVFGARVVRAPRLVHGKISMIVHSGDGVLAGLENPFAATRYHSLILDPKRFPNEPLRITARTPEGEIMGIEHRRHDLWGVQFHPESILTRHGTKLMQNFLWRCVGRLTATDTVT